MAQNATPIAFRLTSTSSLSCMAGNFRPENVPTVEEVLSGKTDAAVAFPPSHVHPI
jgi:hypothetical protein